MLDNGHLPGCSATYLSAYLCCRGTKVVMFWNCDCSFLDPRTFCSSQGTQRFLCVFKSVLPLHRERGWPF